MGFLELAKKAALSGGNVAYSYFRKNVKVEKKKSLYGMDNFTKADVETEKKIKEIILSKFPTHQVVGEESGENGNSDYVWHIDPIDGTNNFIGGNEDWGISVGLAYKKEPIVGVLYFPISKTIYCAEKGKGTTKNGKKIMCKKTKSIERSITCISSYMIGDKNKEDIIKLIRLLGGKCLGMRMYGCAIKNFAMIAEGQISASIKHKLWSWDACAGVVIVREAGGEVFFSNGKDWETSNGLIITTCSKELKKEILELKIL